MSIRIILYFKYLINIHDLASYVAGASLLKNMVISEVGPKNPCRNRVSSQNVSLINLLLNHQKLDKCYNYRNTQLNDDYVSDGQLLSLNAYKKRIYNGFLDGDEAISGIF